MLHPPSAANNAALSQAGDGAVTQSVQRALSILSLFTDEQPGLRVADVQRALGLGQSTVSRLLATLESLGYVYKEGATGQYRLGQEVIRLGGVALNDSELRRLALPELHEAASASGLGSNLAVLRRYGEGDWGAFYLAHYDGASAPRPYTLIGRRNALHATGIGKVLLAHLPEAPREAILASLPLPPYTPQTITTADGLRQALDAVRRRGYATEDEELAFGRACVAGGGGGGGKRRGVGIRIREREGELAQLVVELADRVSTKLGYVTAPVPGLALASLG
jgi:DNA-binding IclR family transcriptional regulator